jgi:RNA polymerase sigma-70 factor, ECF subfamily
MTAGKLIPFPGTTLEQPTDLDLVRAFGRQDMHALGIFFDRHHLSVRRFLSRLYPRARTDIDDWVHATFMVAMESAARFRQGSQPRTWLLGIALNVARQHTRKEMRRGMLLRLLWGGAGESASAPRPDVALEQRQDQARLARAIASLPEGHRLAFVLCDLEELPGKDAATVLGINPGTLGRRLFEARQELRQAMREEEP